jgi:hypothetical protein
MSARTEDLPASICRAYYREATQMTIFLLPAGSFSDTLPIRRPLESAASGGSTSALQLWLRRPNP